MTERLHPSSAVRRPARLLAALIVPASILMAAGAAHAADAERGRSLYENRCVDCHERSVHQRSPRTSKAFGEVREAVVRWSRETQGVWTREDIDDVSVYLNQRYYQFRCPPEICKGNQAMLAPGR